MGIDLPGFALNSSLSEPESARMPALVDLVADSVLESADLPKKVDLPIA